MDKILDSLIEGFKKQYSKSKAIIPPKIYDVTPQSKKEIFDMKFPGLYFSMARRVIAPIKRYFLSEYPEQMVVLGKEFKVKSANANRILNFKKT